MGKANKQRRAAKKRRQRQRAGNRMPPRRPQDSSGDQRTTSPSVDELLQQAVHGWRVVPDVHDAALAAALVLAASHDRRQRGEALHPRWQAQLAALEPAAADPPGGTADVAVAVLLLCLLARLSTIHETIPPPGAAAGAHGVALDARVLARVRGLLAKAEATEFEAEAEALSAKAQELVTRHAIDHALLHADAEVGEPQIRRIHLDDPYADAKAALLDAVVSANRCRTVYSAGFGWASAFGYDHDLDAVELLAASLLAQATAGMARHGAQRDAAGRSRTRSFRRAFLYGFAQRIGQRLQEATAGQVAATEDQARLLPVLATREDRLDAAVEQAFPQLTEKVSSITNGVGFTGRPCAAAHRVRCDPSMTRLD